MKIVHKKWHSKVLQIAKITVLATFALGTTQALARKPAVEPVQGISIDEYREVAPAEEKGFNFDTQERAPSNQTIENAPEQKAPESNTVSWWPLLALPVGLAFMMWNLFKKETQKAHIPDNVVQLPKRKDHDDDQFKKAS